MREHKYKVWSYKFNMFMEILQLHYTDKGIEYVTATTDGKSDIHLFSNEFELLQFTGLTDVDNEEIYEGDIVESAYYYKDQDGFNCCDVSHWVVMWWNEMCEFVLCNHNKLTPLDDNYVQTSAKEEFSQYVLKSDTVLIVGNIYQHGGLLDYEKD